MCALLRLPAVPGSGVLCGPVCWGQGFGCAPPLLGEVFFGCVCGRACAPLASAHPGGPPVARGCAGVAIDGVCPPPSPLVFFGGGGFVLSVARCPGLGSRGLCPPIPSLLGRVVCCLCFLFVPAWCVSACSGCPFSRWAAALGLVLPVLAGWSPDAPFRGPVFSAVWVRGLAASFGVGGRRGGCGPFSRPPPPVVSFLGGGVCLFLPLPSLGWRTHWSAFCVAFRFPVGGCVLPGRAPAPWVGWVMYTLGSAPLLAGLGSGSAGWGVAPGGFLWPWVSRVFSSQRCRFYFSGGSLCGWTATVVAGRAVALCRGVAGWCGFFRGVRWLDLVRPSVSVPCLVLWCVVVRRAASCCVLTCCVVLVCGVLRCALLGCAVLRRAAPWCAALCHVASRRAVACCALGCLVVLLCTVVRCGAVCRAASCCAVVGRWRLVWPVLWCGVRVGAWLVGGWGLRSGVDGSLGPCCGSLGVPLGLVGGVGVPGVALPWGLCRGPVSSGGPGPYPWVLWPCLCPLPVPVRWPLWWPGSSPGGEGVVVGCAAVFQVASSVGVARSPRAGVPSLPCVVSGAWWACAGMICMASDSRFGGVCWGRASPGVVRRPLGVGGRWSLHCRMPFLRVGPAARREVLFPCALVPVPPPSWPLGGFLLLPCVAPSALSLWAPACHLGRFRAPLPECPSLLLALPLPVPFSFPVWWW